MAAKKIQLIIRDSGLGSRRMAEELIREGRVTLNGQVVTHPGQLADPETDHIKVDGKRVRTDEVTRRYYLFNKPRNMVSTFNDPQDRPCIGDLFGTRKKGLFTVGRLDFDAEGLMILTNDGAFAEKMTHPSHAVPRTYVVKVKGNPDEKTLARIRKGMSIGDGERVGRVMWKVIQRQKASTWLRIVLFEGKKNEIKRIFTRIGHPIRRIRRVGFGPFSLGDLPAGKWRALTSIETAKLARLVEKDTKRKRAPSIG